MYPNGTWTGLSSDIRESRVDVGFAQFFNIERRNVFMDPMAFWGFDDWCFAVRRPEPWSRFHGVYMPFTPTVWILIALSLLTVTLAFIYLVKAADKDIKTSNAILFTFGTSLNESFEMQPKSNSLRLLVTLFSLMAMVLSVSYGGILVSFLTVRVYPEAMSSLEELASAEDVKIGAFGRAIQRTFRKDAKYSSFGDENRFVSYWNTAKGLRRVAENGSMAMLDTISSIEFNVRSHFLDEFGEAKLKLVKQCWNHYQVINYRVSQVF